MPDTFLAKHFAFSRVDGEPKVYVQNKLCEASASITPLLTDPSTHIYVCGLKAMEEGVEGAFQVIAEKVGLNWQAIRDQLRESGRYHVETY